MTRGEAREYRHRWNLVEARLSQERRGMSMDNKVALMDICYRTAVECNFLKKYMAEKQPSQREVARRWRRLKGLEA